MDVAVVDEVTKGPGGSQIRTAGRADRQSPRWSLFTVEAPDGLAFTLSRSQWVAADAHLTSPRHRHAFQQIRWTESGAINYAPGTDVPAGSLAYFPKGAYYGPQVRSQGVGWTLQFGFDGEKQHGVEAWRAYQAEAVEALRARGEFEEGVFRYTDPDTGELRVQDGLEALYEEQYRLRTGQEFIIPDPGYDEPILIHPQAFEYYEASPGVEVRNLGRFFDHPGVNGDVRISQIRIAGGTHVLDGERAQVAWSVDAGLTVAGEIQPALASVYSPLGESVDLEASARVEVHVVEFPRRD